MSGWSSMWRISAIILMFSAVSLAQNKFETRKLVINGQSGEITIFQVDGHNFVDLGTLVRLGNGTVSFQGNTILLTFAASAQSASPPTPQQSAPQQSAAPPGNTMSGNFMAAAVQELGILKDWRSIMAYGITRGVPGDGSRMVLNQNRATDALRQAEVAVSTDGDQSAFQLLKADFNNVNKWYEKLVKGRKNMDTGNYSMTEDPLKTDSQYQKIVRCSDFLGTMIPSGTFSDDGSCQ
jgi:hypothetical protein